MEKDWLGGGRVLGTVQRSIRDLYMQFTFSNSSLFSASPQQAFGNLAPN